MPNVEHGDGGGRHVNDFWAWLDTVAPALADLPPDRVLDLVESDDARTAESDPIHIVEAELGREPTVEERAMVLAKVLAPLGTALPDDQVLRAFGAAAERPNPWPGAVVVGAGVFGGWLDPYWQQEALE